MSKYSKVLLALSLGLFVLSYPLCQAGERKVQSEMAKYPKDFVEAHYFDWIFMQHALPGVMVFFLAGACVFAAVVVWTVERIVARKTKEPKT